MHKRISTAFFCLIIIFGILITNLGIIFSNTSVREGSLNRNTRSIEVSQSRGMIYDRNMKKIVNNSTETVTVSLPTEKAFNTIKKHINDEQSKSFYENIKNGKVSILHLPETFNEKHIKSIDCVNSCFAC